MASEKERLLNMLKENKITESDYQLLSASINKNPSRINAVFSLLINPFQKIAGLYALIAGLTIIVLMTYVGMVGKFYSVGIMGCLNASVVTVTTLQPTFLLLLYQNIVVWFIMSMLFFTVGKIFKQKKLRVIDFFGTVALARFPFLILVSILLAMRFTIPEVMNIDMAKGLDLHPSIFMSILSVSIILCFIWETVTYFYALKVSSGLVGKKLWIGFIVALILGEAIASPLTMIFF